MSIPSSQVAAGWVKDAVGDEWISLKVIMSSIVEQKWTGRSSAEVGEYVEDNLYYVAEHLRTELAEARLDGAHCPFEIDEEEDPYIRKIAELPSDLLMKLKTICPFAFEEVCSRILGSLGGREYRTPKTGDGGIDFIVTEIDVLPQDINSPEHCRGAVIGQAKRYNGRLIGEKNVREFIGASLLKRHELRQSGSIGPLTPVLLAFWTTSNFEPNCKVFARKAGVWLMDGATLANYLVKLGLESWVISLPDEA